MRTLPLDTRFGGRVVQVCEGLLQADGTTGQVLELDRLFRAMGLDCSIHTKWFDASLADRRLPLEALQADEHDLLLVHVDDLSGYALPAALPLHTTRVLVYHGIPPAEAFAPDSAMHHRLRAGREQLAQALPRFHRCWVGHGARADELRVLGLPRERCDIVPPIVPPGPLTGAEASRTPGTWLSAASAHCHKQPQALRTLFERVRAARPEAARELWQFGRRRTDDSAPVHADPAAGLHELGQIDDAQRDLLLRRAELFVSTSAYERQGRALIESVHAGLPVVGLRGPGVAEVIGTPDALADSLDTLATLIEALHAEPARRHELARRQRHHVRHFEPAAAAVPLAAALAALLPTPRRFHQVSIVICTYNRAALLARCLDYLRHQTDTRFEVVVVNGPSTDDTEAVIARHAEFVKVVRNPLANLSVSRNLGIAAAAGDLIAFIDDDAIPFDDWVARLLHEFGRRPLTTAALGGPVYYAGSLEFQAQDIGINARAEVLMDMPEGQVGRDGWSRSLLGTNVCLRADVLRASGGFDEQFDYFLDESELMFRLQRQGWLVGYCPELYLRHEFAQSENRSGLHHFNWFSICKNTAYYVARYSGLEGQALRDYLQARIEAERVAPLDAALQQGLLPAAERDRLVRQVHEGLDRGLRDAAAARVPAALPMADPALRPFATPAREPQIGRDLPRLHVCIVTREFPPYSGAGGIGTLYQHLVSELLLLGHHVTVIMPGTPAHAVRRGRLQLRFARADPGATAAGERSQFDLNLAWGLSALAEAAAVHAEQPVDVFDSALWNAEALALSLLPRRPPLVVRLVTPVATVAAHNAWPIHPDELAMLKEAERSLIAQADAVVALSHSITETLSQVHDLVPDRRWHRIPCGVAGWPAFDFRVGYTALDEVDGQPFGVPAGARYVLFVGRLERRKGIDLLLEAARRFLAGHPEVWLVLAGRDIEGWGGRIGAVVGASAAARVLALGEVSTAAREKLMHGARCLVFPSRYESFGLVPLEAFVHGLPVVAMRAGAVPEVVIDGECGLLFEPEDVDGLADRVGRLLGDDDLHQHLAARCHERSKAFGARHSATLTVDLYRQLVARRSSP